MRARLLVLLLVLVLGLLLLLRALSEEAGVAAANGGHGCFLGERDEVAAHEAGGELGDGFEVHIGGEAHFGGDGAEDGLALRLGGHGEREFAVEAAGGAQTGGMRSQHS